MNFYIKTTTLLLGVLNLLTGTAAKAHRKAFPDNQERGGLSTLEIVILAAIVLVVVVAIAGKLTGAMDSWFAKIPT